MAGRESDSPARPFSLCTASRRHNAASWMRRSSDRRARFTASSLSIVDTQVSTGYAARTSGSSRASRELARCDSKCLPRTPGPSAERSYSGRGSSCKFDPLIQGNRPTYNLFNLPQHHPKLRHGIFRIRRQCQLALPYFQILVFGALERSVKSKLAQTAYKISPLTRTPGRHTRYPDSS